MTAWQWIESQGIPGMVISGWITVVSPTAVAGWIWHRISRRRHAERLAAQREHTAALDRQTAALTAYTAALTRPKED